MDYLSAYVALMYATTDCIVELFQAEPLCYAWGMVMIDQGVRLIKNMAGF